MPSQASGFSVRKNSIPALLCALAVISMLDSNVEGQPCASPSSGLVSWWQGEGNTMDAVGSNTGTPTGNLGFVTGRVGQAFSSDGNGDAVFLGNPANLQLQDLTIEAWIKRGSATIASLNAGGGLIVGYGGGGYAFGFLDDGHLFLTQVGVSQVTASIQITDTNFHHVAMTKSGSTVVFYVDGVSYPASSFGSVFTFGSQIAIGARGDNFANSFLGLIDEVDVFNRALTGTEVLAIYSAGATGKCGIAPSIVTQPANQTETVGGNVVFAVAASGTSPLSYQWRFNNTNTIGAGNPSLELTNVQLSNAGSYSVVVSNAINTATSSNATLTVNPAPPCASAPSGLVSWWRAEGNALDANGTNNGMLIGDVTYTAGKIGSAFSFDGSGDVVRLGNPTNLQLQDFTIDAWIRRSNTNAPSLETSGGLFFAYGGGGYAFGLLDDGHLFLGAVGVSAVSSSAQVNDALFHHVAVTKIGSTVVFYVDGVAYSSPSYNPGFSYNSQVAIGGRGDNSANSFLGVIDEVDVFNRALTAFEVQALFNAGSSGKCTPPPALTCVSPPSGLVSWWPGNGNTLDSNGTNHGTLAGNATYAVGRVGQTFTFDGSGDAVQLGNPAAFQLQDFTIEAWIKRASPTVANADGSGFGTALFLGYGGGGYGFGIEDGGHLFLTRVGVDNVTLSTGITDTNFHHVAVTKSGSTVFFYIDGVGYAVPTYNTSYNFASNLAIGARGDNQGAGFFGAIDELALYNRALSAAEVQSIYNASSSGKCGIAPTITSQPANQSVPAGTDVTLMVAATGSSPLSYQWRVGATNIVGATNASLIFSNVQPSASGVYSAVVSNSINSVISSNATLTVNPLACASVPSGLVSWWPANGNAFDAGGTNHGVLSGNASYATGRVGQAFKLNSSGDAVLVGSALGLRLQDFTVEAWIKRSSTSIASTDAGGGEVFAGGGGGYALGMNDNGTLFLTKIGVNNVTLSTGITDTNFHHVAVTKSNSTVFFYIDGTAYSVAAYNPGFTFSSGMAIGSRADTLANSFFGLIDEIAIFNRALTAGEIQGIYYAGGLGKCDLPPAILTQPQSKTIPAGTNVTLSVVATGTPLLSYQWRYNATNIIAGATNASLVISNAQPATNGNFSVVVSNSLNSVTSNPAMLSVRYAFAFGNGQNLTNSQYAFIGSVNITLQTFFTNGTIFYTLDGSPPSFASAQYTGVFPVTQSSILRIITYSADFFQSWSSDPITLTLIPIYTLAATTPGGGTVVVSPTNGPYVSNTVINVTATPTNGWTFLGWLGDASGTNTTIALTMNRNRAVQARFGTMLNTTVAGNGSVSLSPPGGFYPYGSLVQLYATPQSGSYFALWGNAGSGTNNPLDFSMTSANPTVSSLFGTLGAGEFSLTVIPTGFGQVNVNPAANRYNNGDNVTLTATPNAGQQFIGWSGDASGTNNPLIVNMNQSKTVMGNFTRRPSLSVSGNLNGLNDQGFRLTLSGEYGGHYRIDAGTNLLDWTALVTITNTYGTTQFNDDSATNRLRFYRAVEVP